jgi:hypothetical protein
MSERHGKFLNRPEILAALELSDEDDDDLPDIEISDFEEGTEEEEEEENETFYDVPEDVEAILPVKYSLFYFFNINSTFFGLGGNGFGSTILRILNPKYFILTRKYENSSL